MKTSTSTRPAIDDERADLAQALQAARATYDREYPKEQKIVASEQGKLRAIVDRYNADILPPTRATAAARQRMADLDAARGSAELALRRLADPRIRLADDAITEFAERVRVRGEHEKMTALEALERARIAKARLRELEVDLKADVDVELRDIIAATGFTLAELFQHGWRE